MSRVSNALTMLILLKSRGKMKIKELAYELEVSEREVRRYKQDLEMAQIYIKSIPGKYGGYVYENKDYLLSGDLNKEEFNILLTAVDQLQQINAIYCKDCRLLFDKINALKNMSERNSNLQYTQYFIKSIKSKSNYPKDKKLWMDLTSAILTRNKINIKYEGLNSKLSNRIIRPYAIFQYKGDLYCVGYCELRKSIRQFKIYRIQEYEILKEKFKKDKEFNIEKYMENCFGIYKDDEINLVLKIKYPMAKIIKEKIWVENQRILEKGDYIIFNAKMKGKTEIKSWILSMGSSIEVIKPLNFRQEIIDDLNKNLKNYN